MRISVSPLKVTPLWAIWACCLACPACLSDLHLTALAKYIQQTYYKPSRLIWMKSEHWFHSLSLQSSLYRLLQADFPFHSVPPTQSCIHYPPKKWQMQAFTQTSHTHTHYLLVNWTRAVATFGLMYPSCTHRNILSLHSDHTVSQLISSLYFVAPHAYCSVEASTNGDALNAPAHTQ